jgi:hypothetical protein
VIAFARLALCAVLASTRLIRVEWLMPFHEPADLAELAPKS